MLFQCFSRLSDRLNELSESIDKALPKKYNETMATLLEFINNVEGVLLSENAVMTNEAIMEEQCNVFKDLEKQLSSHRETFVYVNFIGQELIAKTSNGNPLIQKIKEELQDLNTKWSDIPIFLQERQQKLSNGDCLTLPLFLANLPDIKSWMFLVSDMKTLKVFNNELHDLENWLDTESKLLAQVSSDTSVDDVRTTENKVRRLQQLCEQIKEMEGRVAKLQSLTNTLIENSEPKFASVLNNKLDPISLKWSAFVDNAKSQLDEYQHALKKNDEVIEILMNY